MVSVKKFILVSAACVTLAHPAVAEARGPLLASRNMASWDGPETKSYCGKVEKIPYPHCHHLKCRKEYKTFCIQPKIDLKRHRIVARLYGPEAIGNPDKQLKDIANACLISGVVLAGFPAIAAAPLGGVSVDIIKQGVQACLETQNTLSQPIAEGFEVTIEEEEFFEH